MNLPISTIDLPTEADTQALAERLATMLRRGDTLLLSGPIGAGKSALARAIVRARLGNPSEDVPSPTFTLVQTYEHPAGDIWHCDLYRLSHPDEAAELGLDEAFEAAICLIEWPDRLDSHQPSSALWVEMSAGDTGHAACLSGPAAWQARLAEGLNMTAPTKPEFLAQTPCANWQITPLAGDASTRSYDRLTGPDCQSAILMDAGPDAAMTVPPFVAIARHLNGLGLCAPDILAQTTEPRFLLLSDLGSTDIARHLLQQPGDEAALYRAAVDVILVLRSGPLPGGLTVLIPQVGSAMLEPLFDWFAPDTSPLTRRQIEQAIEASLAAHGGPADTLSLRDYHAENLIWRPERTGTDRIGPLDFQDAFIAPACYDLVSLLRDARRDVSEATRQMTLAHFAISTGQSLADTEAACAILGLQRNLRILGIFARLAKRDSKAQYTGLIPRVLSHIRADLAHPAAHSITAALTPLLDATSP